MTPPTSTHSALLRQQERSERRAEEKRLTAAEALRAIADRYGESTAGDPQPPAGEQTCPGCGRRLTNLVSARFGIGLTCARRIGDQKADEIAAALEAHQTLRVSTTKPAQLEQLIELIEEWVPLVGESPMADARWAAAQWIARCHNLPLPSLHEMRGLIDTEKS
jgi:hypothetical protein